MTDDACWLGRYVRERRTGAVGKVTADLADHHDVLAVFFRVGEWHSYSPNRWSKAHLFDLIETRATTLAEAAADAT